MFENSEKKIELDQLGEFGLIDHLTRHNTTLNASTLTSIGDDAAVIDYNGNKTVISTDMLVEGVHFDLAYTPLKHLGYKSIMVNLSDIAAMNATPRQVTVSIAVSSRFPLEALEELYEGIYLACKKYQVDLIGGDTTSSKSGLIVSITALGEAIQEDLVYRNGAQENDLLVVTGDLGGAYVGLQVLEREKQIFLENPNVQPDLEGNDYIIERQLKPEARTDIKGLLKALEVQPTSMIDVSDGLASEILHLCKQSQKGATIYEEKIPIDPLTYNRAREFGLDPTVCALSGGEDYELLFTIKMQDFDKIKGNPNLTVIGHIHAESAGKNLVSKAGSVYELKAQGWNAFIKPAPTTEESNNA